MYIRNNIIDRLEKDADEFSYALNIGLKSGESVYVDGITRGEKNGYVNFAKHSTETMLLEIDDSLWRIQAEDVESISVKQYKTGLEDSFRWFKNLFFSESKFKKSTYVVWIKWFLFGVLVSFFYAGVKVVIDGGDIMSAIVDSSIVKVILNTALNYMDKLFLIILIIMMVMFIVDCVLPSDEPYKKIKPFSEYGANPRIHNFGIILMFLLFYKIVATFIYKLI